MHVITHMLQILLNCINHIFPDDIIIQITTFNGNIIPLMLAQLIFITKDLNIIAANVIILFFDMLIGF